MKHRISALIASAAILAAPVAQAGEGDALSASPFGVVKAVPAEEVEALKMPDLAFTATVEDAGNYDKYFYFYRADTAFAVAYADIIECDGYARGLTSTFKGTYVYSATAAGALGGAIGNAMMAAILIPGELRRMRRVNMRQCMGFKGYQRYGLSKDVWESFNFEEGTGEEKEESRMRALKLQALVASRAAPGGKVLPL